MGHVGVDSHDAFDANGWTLFARHGVAHCHQSLIKTSIHKENSFRYNLVDATGSRNAFILTNKVGVGKRKVPPRALYLYVRVYPVSDFGTSGVVSGHTYGCDWGFA